MGIKVKNLDQYVLELRVNGTLTTGANKDCAYIPFSGFITNVAAKAGSGGTGATHSILDVNLDGTTIFDGATKITVASTTGACSYSALTNKPAQVTAGSLLTLDVDAIAITASTVAAVVTISRTPIHVPTNNADLRVSM